MIATMTTSDACEVCPVNRQASLVRLGISMDDTDYVIALAGNPNTGKSTVFNSLTGLRQHTGNWPGKTVTRAEGAFSYSGKKYKIVDLPGTYSLLSTSVDEEVARDFILFGQPDVTVIVTEAIRLERNLNLLLQVLEITDRAVVCVNLIDEARRHHISVDDRALARELGIPVVLTAARQGEGIPQLLTNIYQVATGEFVCQPRRLKSAPTKLMRAAEDLSSKILQEFPGLPNARWVALRLLEGDHDAVQTGELAGLVRKQVEPNE
ncbi:MAG: 50S ribosome-binding GTPase [Ignavibacteriales bacterium]|nr:50S ribosome-binding GTPase [Ignavibacteriales bacterium]